MNNKTILIAGALVGILLIILLPRFLSNDDNGLAESEKIVETVPVVVEPEPVPESLPVVEPVIEPVPVEEVAEVVVTEPVIEVPEPVVLPELNESDSYVIEQINTLENSNSVLQLLASDQTVRKFVMLVESMREGEIPARDLPFLGPRTELTAVEQGETMYEMQPSSYDRYDEIVSTFVNADTNQLVAMYYLSSPLLEQAYAELGIRGLTFQETLKSAMDEVLDVRVSGGEVMLLRPSVQYTFADERLENASSIEKLLVRMGPEHSRAVQAKVREIRDALETETVAD